jgi:hypothetical protein
MLKFQHPVRVYILVFCLFALAAAVPAFGQDFTLQASNMSPASVDPNGTATSTLSLSTLNSTSGVNVSLSCAVTVAPTGSTPPNCVVSPSTITTPASATLTVTAVDGTLPGGYTITITGTGPTTTHETTAIFNVVAVLPQYSLAVTSAMSPTSVHAGNGGSATISIIPTAGYSGTVVLSCASISPAATPSPFCTFSYNNLPPPPAIPVSSGAAVPVTLTISTYGPIITTTEVFHNYEIYAVGAPLLGITLLAGVGSRKKRGRRVLGLMSLFCVAMCLLFIPACGNTNTGPKTIQNSAGNTPNNTYTFTLTGLDENGVAPSNATSVTVELTVN